MRTRRLTCLFRVAPIGRIERNDHSLAHPRSVLQRGSGCSGSPSGRPTLCVDKECEPGSGSWKSSFDGSRETSYGVVTRKRRTLRGTVVLCTDYTTNFEQSRFLCGNFAVPSTSLFATPSMVWLGHSAILESLLTPGSSSSQGLLAGALQ